MIFRFSDKLFADDTSVFSVVENVNETTADLNKDQYKQIVTTVKNVL